MTRQTTMSNTLFEFPLTECQTVRVRCAHCRMVFAVGLERLGKLLPDGRCPQCKTKLTNRNDLAALAQAVRDLAALKEDLEVRFVSERAIVVPASAQAAADSRAGASA
jgi:hypothetical protein